MPLITRRHALAVAGTVAAASSWRKPAAAQAIGTLVPVKPPAPAPALSFVDVNGGTHGLGEFLGRGVVLNCWATWCVPCVQEMPALAGLAGKLRDAGVVVLALSSDRGGAPAVERFFDDQAIKGLDVWLDPHGDVARTLAVRGIPTTVIIDRDGREQARAEGAVDWLNATIMASVRELAGRLS